MLREMAVELFLATVFGIGKAIDRLVAHADRLPFEPHPAGYLLGRPVSLQAVFNGGFQIRVNDQLAMDREALLIFVLSDERVIPI
jgi:hypothetical protein